MNTKENGNVFYPLAPMTTSVDVKLHWNYRISGTSASAEDELVNLTSLPAENN